MGRQAHITRLALGRSPFQEPLLNEDGSFVIGPHVHNREGPGYEQSFDDRGHPQNRVTKVAARRLRKSQNSVLENVGVAVRKEEERKTKWEKLEESERWALLEEENDHGHFLQYRDRLCASILSWSMVSLRTRVTAFAQYSTIPLSTIALKEIHLLNINRWLFSGLPHYFLSQLLGTGYDLSNSIHETACSRSNDDVSLPTVSAINTGWNIPRILLGCIELPLLVQTTLQALHMISATNRLGWEIFVPFSATSPIYLPSLSQTTTLRGVTIFVTKLGRTPLLLYLSRRYLKAQLTYRLFVLFRQMLSKPDRPDLLSVKTLNSFGLGTPLWQTGNRSAVPDITEFVKNERDLGPRSFMGALRITFPPLYKLINAFSGGRLARSRGRLPYEFEQQLRAAVTRRYWEHRGSLQDPPKRETTQDIIYRQSAFEAVFRSANINAVEELVDPSAWLRDVLGPNADERRFSILLQKTPDDHWNDSEQPNHLDHEGSNLQEYDEAVARILAEVVRAIRAFDLIVIQAVDGQAMIIARQPAEGTDLEELDNIRTIDAGDIPLRAFMRGARALNRGSEETIITEPLLRENQPLPGSRDASVPRTPIPGISRALSLDNPQVHVTSQPHLRPLRRPTETDDSLAAISRTWLAEAEALQSAQFSVIQPPSSIERFDQSLRMPLVDITTVIIPMKHRQYRVTALSNYAANSLAWHSSTLLASIILWPLEAIWVRSIAEWALHNPLVSQSIDPWWSARLGFGIVGRPITILGLHDWFGGSHNTSGKLSYAGSILMTLGLEGILRGLCWRIGVCYLKRAKDKYGWGQF